MKTVFNFSRYFGAVALGCCLSSSLFALAQDTTTVELSYTKLLNQQDFPNDPLSQLTKWQNQAAHDAVEYPRAAALATVKDGSPAVRTIRVNKITDDGIVFATDPSSEKAKQFAQQNKVALLFVWHDPVLKVSRQVIVNGIIRPYAPASKIVFRMLSGNKQVLRQYFEVLPDYIEFSQLQHVHNNEVVEYVRYIKTDGKWIKSTRDDYLASNDD